MKIDERKWQMYVTCINFKLLKFTSWWLNVLLLCPFIITGINKSYTKVRQSAVGVATSII